MKGVVAKSPNLTCLVKRHRFEPSHYPLQFIIRPTIHLSLFKNAI